MPELFRFVCNKFVICMNAAIEKTITNKLNRLNVASSYRYICSGFKYFRFIFQALLMLSVLLHVAQEQYYYLNVGFFRIKLNFIGVIHIAYEIGK